MLLGASVLYYLFSDNGILILYPIGAVLVSFLGIRIMERADREKEALQERGKSPEKIRKRALLFVIFANVAVLFLLKYINFGINTVNGIAALFGRQDPLLSGLNWLVPLGISYYSLSLIGYVTDVYFGIAKPQRNPAKMALYGMFFPCMLSGPILKYREDADQFFLPHPFDYVQVTRGMQRMLWEPNVWIIDHRDSFTWNLAELAAATGMAVPRVVPHDSPGLEMCIRDRPGTLLQRHHHDQEKMPVRKNPEAGRRDDLVL